MARPKDKRENIITSASEIFGCKGFHQANIVDIADNAGIGKGTVYEYFKSKNELFLEVVKHNTQVYLERLTEEVLKGKGFHDQLNRYIAIHRQIIGENYESTGIFINTPSALSVATENSQEVLKILFGTRSKVVAIIRDILVVGSDEQLIRANDLDYTADIIFDMVSRNSIRGFQFSFSEDAILKEQKKLIAFILFGLSKDTQTHAKGE